MTHRQHHHYDLRRIPWIKFETTASAHRTRLHRRTGVLMRWLSGHGFYGPHWPTRDDDVSHISELCRGAWLYPHEPVVL